MHRLVEGIVLVVAMFVGLAVLWFTGVLDQCDWCSTL